jgi:hypothetical protein
MIEMNYGLISKKKKRVFALFLSFFIVISSVFLDNNIKVKASEDADYSNTGSIYNGVDYSKVYDYNYYINRYEDLRNAFGNDEAAALKHFVIHGMREGRQASPAFDVYSYKNANQDLRIAFGNDLQKYYEHYLIWGYKENRAAQGVERVQNPVTRLDGVDYSRVYDYNYYIEKYADLKNAFGNDDIAALKHFIKYGMKEGRQAKAAFNVIVYRNSNEDLRKVYGNDLQKYYEHYLIWGYKEGRVTQESVVQNPITTLDGVDYSKVYDFNYYINNYSDLKKAFGNDDVAALKHFVKYGMKEGRKASEGFDLKIYKSNYADLRRAFGNTQESNKDYYMHFVKYGSRECRNAVTVDGIFTTDTKSDIVFVGDSRTVGLYYSCKNFEGSYIAKSGMGLNWLKLQLCALYDVKNKIILINMGVNDLENIDEYLRFYNSLPNEFVQNNKVVFLTVNPVDEQTAVKNRLYHKNSDINSFNSRMKNELRKDIYILDSNSYLVSSGFKAYDGLHYNDATNKKIYKWVVEECKKGRFLHR